MRNSLIVRLIAFNNLSLFLLLVMSSNSKFMLIIHKIIFGPDPIEQNEPPAQAGGFGCDIMPHRLPLRTNLWIFFPHSMQSSPASLFDLTRSLNSKQWSVKMERPSVTPPLWRPASPYSRWRICLIECAKTADRYNPSRYLRLRPTTYRRNPSYGTVLLLRGLQSIAPSIGYRECYLSNKSRMDENISHRHVRPCA